MDTSIGQVFVPNSCFKLLHSADESSFHLSFTHSSLLNQGLYSSGFCFAGSLAEVTGLSAMALEPLCSTVWKVKIREKQRSSSGFPQERMTPPLHRPSAEMTSKIIYSLPS